MAGIRKVIIEMDDFREKDYKVFEMFDKNWAVVTAGTMDNFNGCTVSWGSMGNIWGSMGKSRPIITVYVHPARYTGEFLNDSDTFTVSFFPEKYRKALVYIGSNSGRDGEKTAASGLTPKAMGESVTYEEANLTFLCKKLYQNQFSKENLHCDIRKYYASFPEMFPDFNGGWQPHNVFMGEIVEVEDRR